ncbi:MAG: hypothetical protein AAF491_01815 [Verrucomicrobiota bacterium]
MNTPPKALSWFRLYLVLLALFYLGLIGLGVVFLAISPESLQMTAGQTALIGCVFILLGVLFLLVVLPAFALPRRGGAWIYGLALIVLGMTSVVLVPVSLPLLIQWMREPVKNWFVPIDP